MESDKLFNLQIAVQQLEEELSLYRNGMDGRELLNLIKEKDAEILSLQSSVSDSQDKLRKIGRASSDVVSKCETLKIENVNLVKNLNELTESLERARASYTEKEVESEQLLRRVKELEEADNSNCKRIEQLEAELMDRDESIEKLQKRCAALVTEKSEQGKLLAKEKAERAKQIKEYRDELDLAVKFNTEIKTRFSTERSLVHSLTTKVAEMKNECSKAKAEACRSLQELQTVEAEGADLARRMADLQSSRDCLAADLQQAKQSLEEKENYFHFTLSQQDLLSRQLQQRITDTEVSFKTAIQQLEEEFSRHRAQSDAELSQVRQELLGCQTERDRLKVVCKEAEVVQLKLKNCEREMRKKDIEFRKVLGDRTNAGSAGPRSVSTSVPSGSGTVL